MLIPEPPRAGRGPPRQPTARMFRCSGEGEGRHSWEFSTSSNHAPNRLKGTSQVPPELSSGNGQLSPYSENLHLPRPQTDPDPWLPPDRTPTSLAGSSSGPEAAGPTQTPSPAGWRPFPCSGTEKPVPAGAADGISEVAGVSRSRSAGRSQSSLEPSGHFRCH